MRRLSLALVVVALAAAVLLWLQPAATAAPASSTGCSPSRPHAAGSFNRSLVTDDGLTREYILHVPPSYTGADATPLVLNFHGLGSTAAQQEAFSGMSTTADQPEGGIIVVYPQGTPAAFGGGRWNVTQAPPPDVDDVSFVDQLLSALHAELCIDRVRTYSTGMSNGAQMSIRLACSLSLRIAAIAPVAGSYYPPAFRDISPDETCLDTRPVPLIAFHGTADTIVPFDGGPGLFGIWFRLPIDNDTPDEDVMSSWAAHNGCAGARQEAAVKAGVSLVSYGDCELSGDVQLYAIDGGGHVWPTAVSTNDLIWEFFQSHLLATVGGVTAVPDVAGAQSQSSSSSRPITSMAAGAAAAAVGPVAVGGAALWAHRRRA